MAAAKKKAAFIIDSEILRQLEERVPEQQRSQFVEDALAKALDRDPRRRALDTLENTPAWPTAGRPAEDVLREVREDWGRRLAAPSNNER